LIAVDSNYEEVARRETRAMNIPLIAIMNSDCNPEDADYPIPANDSSITSVNYLLSELVKAYSEGRIQINE